MKEINYELLGKILSNEATPEERVQFQNWLDKSKDNKQVYNTYKLFYDNSTIKETNHLSFNPRIETEMPRRSNFSKVYWAVAASIVFIISLSSYFYLKQFNNFSKSSISENEIHTYANPSGKKSRFLLPDNSVVWLNSESKIEYVSNAADSSRRVYLEGEAYFMVARDTLMPFIVDVGALQATVLGTEFNVQSYPESDLISVGLATGKLLVGQENRKETLLPGSGIEFSKADHQLNKVIIDVDRFAAWKDGVLIFEQEDLPSVVSRLQRWYGVEISLEGQLSPDWSFTGYFDNEYLSNVLEVLCYGKSLNYKIEENHVRIIRQQKNN